MLNIIVVEHNSCCCCCWTLWWQQQLFGYDLVGRVFHKTVRWITNMKSKENARTNGAVNREINIFRALTSRLILHVSCPYVHYTSNANAHQVTTVWDQKRQQNEINEIERDTRNTTGRLWQREISGAEAQKLWHILWRIYDSCTAKWVTECVIKCVTECVTACLSLK